MVLFQNTLQNVADGAGVQQIPEEPPSAVSNPQGITENQDGREKINPRHNQFCVTPAALPLAACFMFIIKTLVARSISGFLFPKELSGFGNVKNGKIKSRLRSPLLGDF
jgi:hypothetical protein